MATGAVQSNAAGGNLLLGARLSPSGPLWSTGLPVLYGNPVELVFCGGMPDRRAGAWTLYRDGPWLLGAASVPVARGAEPATRALYDDLFQLVGRRRLARVWHYVPTINVPESGGLERYRAFSRGRSLAFESAFGSDFHGFVPAASAVGTDGEQLVAFFAATEGDAWYVENPQQVPAYRYPAEHGPRSPTFARATVVAAGGSRSDVFISGTAAIRGHATVAPHEIVPQLACTLENLAVISEACHIGADLARGRAARRLFKVYLRHAGDLPYVRSVLERELVTPEDQVVYLRSDVCRAELDVEIEATLWGVPKA